MKKIIPLLLALGICIFALISCGQSASQVLENLSDKGYETFEWDDEDIDSQLDFVKSDDYNFVAVYSGVLTETDESTQQTNTETVIVVQLKTHSQAKKFVEVLDDTEEFIGLEYKAEGRLVIIGTEKTVNDALDKN